jgi:hypothetical protein
LIAVREEARPSIVWTGIVVFMLGLFTAGLTLTAGSVALGDFPWPHSRGEAIVVALLFTFNVLGFLNSARELRSLSRRWDSMLAQPAMWTAAIGSVFAFMILWARQRPWESRSTECFYDGSILGTGRCVEHISTDTSEAVLAAVALAICGVAFLAAASVLIYTWRDMRPGL